MNSGQNYSSLRLGTPALASKFPMDWAHGWGNNRRMMHVPASRDARPVESVPWRFFSWAWLVVCGVGCSGCYQSAVVPPTTSISPPMRTVPVVPNPGFVEPKYPDRTVPEPIEPLSPPGSHPVDPITVTNPWKPELEARDWNYIVLHHTASTSGSVESIHQEHLKRKDKAGNSWLGIGYHFVIGNGNGMEDGEIEPTFRWRQQLQGAHAGVADFNQHGIGIVLIGNFENTPPSEAQTASVKRLVGVLKREYGVAGNRVVGHNDVKATECPGKHFPMSDVRDSIALSDKLF